MRALQFYIGLLFLTCLPILAQAQDKNTGDADLPSGVILAYHRIGEDLYPDTTLDIDKFDAHLQEILNGQYHVMRLPVFIKALRQNTPVPENTLVITFEGGFASAYRHAMARLIEHEIPFSVFFSSDQASSGIDQYMSWQDLQDLQKTGLVDFGILPASYARFYDAPREEILTQINKARVAFRTHLGGEPQFFSYPFGEYSLVYKNLIEHQGFHAAFGLHSGAAYAGADLFALPRFSMTQGYGSLDRFQLVARALPLQVDNVLPADPDLESASPSIGFSLGEDELADSDQLSCFISGQGKVKTEILGKRRVELRLEEPLTQTRTRINCTLPVKSDGEITNWRWFGMLLIPPSAGDEDEEEGALSLPQGELP